MDINFLSGIMDLSFVSVGELFTSVQPLMITLFALAAFAIFILEFYEFVATRDIFKEGSAYSMAREELREREYTGKFFNFLVTSVEYLLLFPVIVFFWCGVFFLIIVAISEVNVNTILLTSVAIVGAIRICAYYSRKIAEDVAKLLPLVMLGNFVLDIRMISPSATYETIKTAFLNPAFQQLAIYYLIFIIMLEFVLRMVSFAWNHRKLAKDKEEDTKEMLETTNKFTTE